MSRALIFDYAEKRKHNETDSVIVYSHALSKSNLDLSNTDRLPNYLSTLTKALPREHSDEFVTDLTAQHKRLLLTITKTAVQSEQDDFSSDPCHYQH